MEKKVIWRTLHLLIFWNCSYALNFLVYAVQRKKNCLVQFKFHHIILCVFIPASVRDLFSVPLGVTASPRSQIQQLRSVLTRMFLVFISRWAMHSLPKSECRWANPLATPKLILPNVGRSRVFFFKYSWRHSCSRLRRRRYSVGPPEKRSFQSIQKATFPFDS